VKKRGVRSSPFPIRHPEGGILCSLSFLLSFSSGAAVARGRIRVRSSHPLLLGTGGRSSSSETTSLPPGDLSLREG